MFRLTGLAAAILAAGLTMSAPAAHAGKWEDGLKAFAKKEYAAAAKLFRPLAEKGNAVAQYRIALMHKMGLGVSKDRKQAQKWGRTHKPAGAAPMPVITRAEALHEEPSSHSMPHAPKSNANLGVGGRACHGPRAVLT